MLIKLLLADLDNKQHSASCIHPNTITNWIKSSKIQARTDTTKHQPHSIRSAAVQLGFKIDKVKKHANWSLNGNAFEKYYYKPINPDRVSTSTGNFMINNTISGVRTKVTKIGVGTSYTNVAAERTETTLAWYRRLLDYI